jgi:hypothetical protein
MESMKSISTQILILMICLDLVLAPFPKVSYADNTKSESQPSPSAYLKTVQAEAEALFDPKTGCATIDDNGVATVKNETTQSDIHGDPNAKSSLDCAARVKAFLPAWNKAQEIVKQYEQADKSNKNGAQCSDCNVGEKTLNTDFMVPKDGLCSLKEKKQIAASYKSGKCGFASNLSVGSCLDDILGTFKSSMVSMVHTAVSGMKAAGNWLIKSHKQSETAGTQKSLVLSGMDAETIAKAQENGEKATAGTVEKTVDFFGKLSEFIGVDYPAYKEQYLCAKCGDRADAICKMVGILGKDIVKNALIIWVTGGVFKLAGKGIKAIAGRSVGGRAMVAWGEKRGAAIAETAIKGWRAFETTLPAMAKIAKFGGKVVLKTFEVTDKVMTFPIKLAVSGGEKIAATRAGMKIRSVIFKRTPGLNLAEKAIGDEAAVAGMVTVEKVSQESAPLVIESGRIETTAMAAAKKDVGKIKDLKSGKQIDVTGIENATESKFEIAGNSVKTETKNGPQYFNVGDKPESVKQIFPYGPESKNAIIRMDDGSLIISENGRLANRVAKKDASKVEALLGREQKASDKKLLDETVNTGKMNGVDMTEENSTAVLGKDGKPVETASFNTGADCGNQKITIRAGSAF